MAKSLELKYLMARMALEDPGRFWSTFDSEGGADYLTHLWCAMHELPLEAVSGIANEIGIERRGEVLVLTLPAPREPNDPFALAVVGNGKRIRFFVLESSPTPAPAFLIEISMNGRASFGPMPDSSNDGFSRRVAEIAGAPA